MPLIRKPPSASASASPGAGTKPAAPNTPAVFDALAHGTDDERWSAARAAVDLPGAVPALEAALKREQSSVVREAIFSALARIASPQSVDAVVPFLRSDDALVRTEATDALQAMRETAWPRIEALLRDPDADVRALACGLARDMPRDVAVRLYCDVLDSDPDVNVCAAAVEVLAEVGTAAALPALERCATRFSDTPFLAFSIQTTIGRLRAQAPTRRA